MPSDNGRSASGDIQKKAEVDFEKTFRRLPGQITTGQLFTVIFYFCTEILSIIDQKRSPKCQPAYSIQKWIFKA